MQQSNKIGFWSVFAIVTGSQIGSGVFMLPASLAPFGLYGLFGWIISAIGAIALCSVFASLCARFPKTGGPHVYVQKAFGPAAGFFCGWTYWIISWVSTPAVIVTTVGYLSPFIPHGSPPVYLAIEIILLFFITMINLKGVKAAGHAEFVLTILKIVPLLIMPLFAVFYFNSDNIVMSAPIAALPTSKILAQVALLTLWGFIGLECATAPAESVEQPEKNIPKAIVLGTSCVALLYIFNSIGMLGLIPGAELSVSKAPYVDAVQRVLGGNWHYAISIIAAVVCIGTLNAWVLTSGQIALGLSQDKLMPAVFKKQNKYDAPYFGIIVSCSAIVPFLFFTASDTLAQQVTAIIDFSVVAFLFVYLACCVSFIKLLIKEKKPISFLQWTFGLIALAFCIWVLAETSLTSILISAGFVLSGLPVYFFWYRRNTPSPTATVLQ